jgi:fructose-bisphosphate aldolase class I
VRVNERQLALVRSGRGFIAALDQSGGSAPAALARYGIDVGPDTGSAAMLDLMHRMRTRIMTSRSFSCDRVLGAILFAGTLDRQVDGRDTADYLWNVKGIVPFVKIDVGLADERDGVRLMKPIPDLSALLAHAAGKDVFGTKMRSLVTTGDATSIGAVVEQQFMVAREVLAADLVPIIEPEVSIDNPRKADAEADLLAALSGALGSLESDQQVMLKLTLPSVDGLYDEFVAHPRVLRVAALSGGYDRDEATQRLGANRGMIASFSRALTEGLHVDQSDDDFDARLAESIAAIFEASIT